MLRSDYYVRWPIVPRVFAAQREAARSRRSQGIVSSEGAAVKMLDGRDGVREGGGGFVWFVQLAGLSQ